MNLILNKSFRYYTTFSHRLSFATFVYSCWPLKKVTDTDTDTDTDTEP